MNYTHNELFCAAYWHKYGFVSAVEIKEHKQTIAHLYVVRPGEGTLGRSLCAYGDKTAENGYTLLSDNTGESGVCANCIRNARRVVTERARFRN